MPAPFPEAINSPHLGPLRLHVHTTELPEGDPIINRVYRPAGPLPVPARGRVELLIWPPEAGIPDPAAFAALIEQRWHAITATLDQTLLTAEPIVWEAVRGFSDPSVEGWPPDAATLLRTARLEMIKISGEDDAADAIHELQFNCIDYLGDHDLILNLRSNLTPLSAHFDG